MNKFIISFLALMVFASITTAAPAEKFPIKDLSINFDSMMEMTSIQGEITNNSGKSYQSCIFKMSFYDANKKLIGTADVVVMNFNKGETVTFDAMSDKNLSKAKSYKIRLDVGV